MDVENKRMIPPSLGRADGWPWERPGPEAKVALTETPRVSVVVPSYNQGHFIEATIRSVLLQDYPAIELIVMDGGSSDGTLDVLRHYDEAIDFWASEPDRGQTHAINKGMERATGEIVTYLNSDDMLHPGAVRRVVEEFQREPEAGVVHGQCLYVDEAGRERFRQGARVDSLLDYIRIWRRFPTGNYITQPEAFIRQTALEEAGPFREDLHNVMDFEMWLRLLSNGVRFHSVPDPVAHFRTYPSQKSSVDPGDEICRVVEEYANSERTGLVDSERAALLDELTHARAQLLARASIAANLLGERTTALRYLLRALRVSPAIATERIFWSAVAGFPRSLLARAEAG